MVHSYRTLLADGSIQISGRPQSANSRSRIDTTGLGSSPDVKVYANNLYDGDILAAECSNSPSRGGTTAPRPMPPASANEGNTKFQQQRAMAAQKRLERLQLGNVAQQSNDGMVVVSLGSSGQSGTPGTPKPPAALTNAETPGGAVTGGADSNSSTSTAASPVLPAHIISRPIGAPRSSTAATGELKASVAGTRPSSAIEKSLLAKGVATVYDPTDDEEIETIEEADSAVRVQPGSSSSSRDTVQGIPTSKLDLSSMSRFLLSPGPQAGPVQCFIERDKGSMGKPPCYRMYLDDSRRFLLAARKRVKSASSNYVISCSSDNISRHNSSYIGKLCSNFLGTEFCIYDVNNIGTKPASALCQAGSNNPAASGSTFLAALSSAQSPGVGADSSGMEKLEKGAVLYQTNVLGTRGPRKMSAAVPAIGADGSSLWRPSGPDDSILDRLKTGRPCASVIQLKNKTPRWNEALNAYCLNFSGRVTEASVKNFQLVTDMDPDNVVLQFGKLTDSCFTCDFMWPLSPMQAFCICLSSFDHKLACE